MSKLYPLGVSRRKESTLAGSIISWMRAPLHNYRGLRRLSAAGGKSSEILWALKDVSFDVAHGEIVGIIGRNGAGKSTLLKILAQITSPTYGTATIHGRVASLLEVGTGFHPELTGRENVYLNGSILGMSKAEIDKKFDAIAEFSGVERFLDTPVKRYSSGMQVRLAFSVAAHLEPEVLIIDEVLAVGDAEFQAKCVGKMRSVAERGDRTVLFVSHNMPAIKRLCSRCILLNEGQVTAVGSPDVVIRQYLSSGVSGGRELKWQPDAAPGSDELKVTSFRLLDANGETASRLSTGGDLYVEVKYSIRKDLANLRIALTLLTEDGVDVLSTSDFYHHGERRHREPGDYISVCIIPGGLLNTGRYIISVNAEIPTVGAFVRDVRLPFEIEELSANHLGVSLTGRPLGVIHPDLEWQVTQQGKRARTSRSA